MATTINEVINREAPVREAQRTAYLNQMKTLTDSPVNLPQKTVAGLTPEQTAARNLYSAGIGSYQPYLDSATDAQNAALGYIGGGYDTTGIAGTQTGMGAGMINAASNQLAANQAAGMPAAYQQMATEGYNDPTGRNYISQGIGGLQNAGAMFDPASASGFMNQYEDTAVQQALQDIQRQGDIAAQQGNANAVSAGAFGGARSGIQAAELQRNVLDQQGRTAANMRNTGYMNALQNATAAFENSANRGITGATNTGQLGNLYSTAAMNAAGGIGNLGLGFGKLDSSNVALQGDLGTAAANTGSIYGNLAGIQSGIGRDNSGVGMNLANIGGAGVQYGSTQANDLYNVGANIRNVNQLGNDATYANQMATVAEPYNRLMAYGDALNKTPSTQSSMTASTTPNAGMANTIVGGLGTAAGLYGASRSGGIV
tara:strand:+ start:2137 stop:3420 length:1284 start_codon:yes stop_codon:yes gene_type:complete